MAASKQEVYFIAIRMHLGFVRRELPLVGLGEEACSAVLDALDDVEAQLREWHATGLVPVAQLQELLGALMRLPGELRTLKESGEEGRITARWLEERGVVQPQAPRSTQGSLS